MLEVEDQTARHCIATLELHARKAAKAKLADVAKHYDYAALILRREYGIPENEPCQRIDADGEPSCED